MINFSAMMQKLNFPMVGKSPWGGSASGEDEQEAKTSSESTPDEGDKAKAPKPNKGPKNPWLPSGDDGTEGRRAPNIEDIFKYRGKKGGEGGSGSGGGFGGGGANFRLPERGDGKSWLPLLLVGAAGLWVFSTAVHQVEPKEQAVVTWLGGKYSNTLSPGINLTFPFPIQSVDKESVSDFREETIPDAGGEQRLMLTGDQNLVDLTYTVRWNVKDLRQFRFQLADPEKTVREVAEATMRASVGGQSLDQVLSGAGRARIESDVMLRMQAMLDAYRSGVAVQGVQIGKTDPPKEVEQAFKDVTAAQQKAESYRNQAEAAAQQVLAQAQGEAAAFDKVYEQYRLAPEVTRQRMYYETMERVLRQNDKTVIEASGVTPYLPLPEMRKRQNAAKQGEQ